MRNALRLAAALALCSTVAFAQSSPPGTGNMTPNGAGSAAPVGATLQANPTNPTGTASGTAVMMGLGSTCKITPTYSSRVEIDFYGSVGNSTTGATTAIHARYGTGTAPANGAAAAGTVIGGTVTVTGSPAAFLGGFEEGGIITSLTPGTPYWFDLDASQSGGTSALSGISCKAKEF
jgi:hypothetical protein